MRDEDELRTEIARLRAANEDLEARAARAEEDLRTSRAIHAALIESLPFDFWARDREGYCFSQNAATRAKWGNLIGKRPGDLQLPASIVEAWLANNRRALAGERVTDERTYEVNDRTAHVLSVLSPIRMGEAIIGTLGVNIDMTELKRADMDRSRALDALRESEEKLRLAVHAAGIGIWSWDLDTDAVTFNDALCAIFGVTPDNAPPTLEEYVQRLVHPDERARFVARVTRGREHGSWQHEYRVVRTDGTTRWVLGCGKVLHVHGQMLGLGAIFDVTERKERDEQLRQAQKVDAVGQLSAGIAHNFNNMLMGILPNLELAERCAPPEIVPLLKSAEHSAHRAADLVRRLMTFAGRNRPNQPGVEAVASIVERAVELCRTTFDRRISFVTHIDGAPRVLGDAGQLQQAIVNLLINARDALDGVDAEAPRVSIEACVVGAGAAELDGRDRDYVRVRVRDNGVGMGAETLAHLYEPFFTTKVRGKGTGLGLATTHAIVREHGGFVICASAPGRGTTFSVYVPSETRPIDQAPASVPAPAARGTETVLVVDDEPAIRTSVMRVLRDAGYAALAVASGEDALSLLAQGRVGAEVRLLILDVSMPGMPSNVLRARLRDIAPNAKVVYFTGYAWDASDTADVVLEKPVSVERLLATVRDVLDRA
jgi:PAS domain S-box-containing protein